MFHMGVISINALTCWYSVKPFPEQNAGVLNIVCLDGSRRAMFFDCVKQYKIPISKCRNYKTNVILLSVREKVFLNEPIVTLSENIVLEIRRQHTRRA